MLFGRQYETHLVTLNGVTFLPSTIYLSFDFIILRTYYLTKTDPVVAEVVSRRPVIAEARIHYQVSPCGIFGGRSGTLDRIFSEYCGLCHHFTSAPCLLMHPPMLYNLSNWQRR